MRELECKEELRIHAVYNYNNNNRSDKQARKEKNLRGGTVHVTLCTYI
jgi:hypothetical protein